MKSILVLGLSVILSACHPYQNIPLPLLNKKDSARHPQDEDLFHEFGQPLIEVTDLDGSPLQGALVLFGPRVGQPFQNNLLETNSAGQALAPTGWNSPMSVSVQYPGKMKVTYTNVLPRNLKFQLRPLSKNRRIELSGQTSGFGPLKRDNVADFGLVISGLTRRDLFSFSMDKIISPESDVIDVAGFESKVPSNLTFPKQRETYVIPVTIEKERYRMYFDEPGTKKIYALHGKFPFKEVVDKIRTKAPFVTLINHFEFNSASLRDIVVTKPTVAHLPVNEINFTTRHTIVPPRIPSDRIMLALSLFERDGHLYPADMHKVERNQPFSLKGLTHSPLYFLSLVARSSDFHNQGDDPQEAISAEFLPQSQNHTPQFVDLIPPPTPTSSGWMTQPPSYSKSVLPLSTYSVHSTLYASGKQAVAIRDWEVYSEGWVDSAELPDWSHLGGRQQEDEIDSLVAELDSEPTLYSGKQKWEVTYIGTNQKLPIPKSGFMGPDVIDYTTHISYNSFEY